MGLDYYMDSLALTQELGFPASEVPWIKSGRMSRILLLLLLEWKNLTKAANVISFL